MNTKTTFKKICDLPMNEQKVIYIKQNVQNLTLNQLLYLALEIEKTYYNYDRGQIMLDFKRIIKAKKAFIKYDRLEREYEEKHCS